MRVCLQGVDTQVQYRSSDRPSLHGSHVDGPQPTAIKTQGQRTRTIVLGILEVFGTLDDFQ